MSEDWLPDIFTFLDYRAYLGAYYKAAKKNVPAFSYRYFSRRAGYASPNFLKLVVKGDRGLSAESIERFARAIGLDNEERRFFKHLVQFNQASTSADRNLAFEKIAASQRFQQARRIDRGMYTYLSRWYYPAIREMVAREDFEEDAVWIANQLLPSITPEQAGEALELLEDMTLVVRDEGGRLRRGESTLTTGHEVRSLAIGNYHRQMLARASDSIEDVASADRDLSALTVCIEAETVPELKKRIHRFRERLIDRCDGDDAPSVVYQINIQCFPLTHPGRGRAGTEEDA